MPPAPRLTGEPIMRILCKKTDSLVGYLYQWDNGDLQPAWLKDAMADVRHDRLIKLPRKTPPSYRTLVEGCRIRHIFKTSDAESNFGSSRQLLM